jgi:hypothetical protein
MSIEDKIEQLRKSQRESHALMEDIYEKMESKCSESLLDVLDSILENIDQFPDTASAIKAVYALTGKDASTSSSSSSKKDKKLKIKKETEDV